jgi:biopolymer transport protein ExbD
MVTAALIAASTLGVAAAESPTSATTPPHVVSVSGAGRAPIAQGAEQSAANAAYHQALTAAVEDGKGKAELLAADAGVTLASVQSVIEGGGSVGCTGLNAEGEYVPYEGTEPDFGNGGVEGVAVPERAAASAPVVSKSPKAKKKKKKKPKGAKAASAAGCTVSADVSLIYAIA